jgi:hypothetical protein
MKEIIINPNQNQVSCVPAGTGPRFRRPRDKVTDKALAVVSPVRDAYGDARALLILFIAVAVLMIVALVF